jgi:predicted RND superfamily exporter protein
MKKFLQYFRPKYIKRQLFEKLQNWRNRFSCFVVSRWKFVVIATIIITILAGISIRWIKINSDLASYLPESDSAISVLNYIGKEYEGNYLAIIALQTDDIFNKATIKRIDQLTSDLQILEGVASVTSLTNVIDIKKSEDGIEIGNLIDRSSPLFTNLDDHDTLVQEELKKLKNTVFSKERLKGQLVSEDAKVTLIVCRLVEGVDQAKAATRIKETVENTDLKENVRYGGMPFQILDIMGFILKDLWFLVPLICLLMVIALGFSFRSMRGIVLPLSAVLITVIWTFGIMGILKFTLTVVSDIIPVILIAIGSAYSIHVISKCDEENDNAHKADHKHREEKTSKALRAVSTPVLLAAITTIAGFISFAFGSYLTAIKEFGIFSGLGVLFAFIVSITFVPAMLQFFYRRGKVKNTPAQKNKNSSKTDKHVFTVFMNRFSAFILKNAKTVMIIVVIACIAACFGIPRIQRKAEIISYFSSRSNIRKTEAMMDKKFGGSIPIQILVRGDIQDPLILTRMKQMEHYLETEGEVNNLLSIADLIEEANDVMGEGKQVPDSKAKVGNLFFLLEGEEIMSQLINQDKTEAIIQGTVPSGQSKKQRLLTRNIDHYIKDANSESAEFLQAGPLLAIQHLDESLLQSQIVSLILAMALICICVVLLLRSFLGGLIGLIPIGFTLIIVFGFMGFVRIPLDIATVLVGSIAIGTGIDYTIHFINRFKNERKSGKTIADALGITMQTTGKAILINVATVTLGFLVLVFANLIPLQRFGMLVAITTLGSGFGAMTVLPAIILLTKINFANKEIS